MHCDNRDNTGKKLMMTSQTETIPPAVGRRRTTMVKSCCRWAMVCWFLVGVVYGHIFILQARAGFSFGGGLIFPEKFVFWVLKFRFFYYRALNTNGYPNIFFTHLFFITKFTLFYQKAKSLVLTACYRPWYWRE
jgi:hypothetical protein